MKSIEQLEKIIKKQLKFMDLAKDSTLRVINSIESDGNLDETMTKVLNSTKVESIQIQERIDAYNAILQYCEDGSITYL